MTSPQQQKAPNGFLATGVPAASVDEARDDMVKVFEEKQAGLKTNTDYYDSLRRPDAIGIAVPQAMRKLLAHVGYPRLYVDSLAERQELEGFRLGGVEEADTKLWDWWQANDLDVEATLGHTDSLIHGRSYITVSKPDPATDPGIDPNVPIIRVEPPTALHAVIDPRTRQVTQAIRAVYDESGEKIISSTLYLPSQTVVWIKDDSGEWVVLSTIAHNLEMVPIIPISNRTRLSDLYGTSQITPEIRSATDAAARILMDMQATAELMAVPQRLIFGAKPQEVGVDPATGQKMFDAYIAAILAFEDPQGKAEQFLAAELRNYADAIAVLDKKIASYTGLPPQYLAAASDNPASAEAIKASESRLVKAVERKNKIFGGAWEQAMRVATKVMGGGDIPPAMYRMESIWRDPSTPTYAAKADAASKLYAGGLGLIPKERGRIDMGYSEVEREQMKVWDTQENPVVGALGQITNPKPGAAATPQKPVSAAKPTATTTQSPQS